MLYFDSETVGRHGVAVLFQYAVDDGPVELWDVWTNPARKTLELIEWICDQDFVGFNIAFDWFHVVKLYTMLRRLKDSSVFPEDAIDELAYHEEQARFDDICLRPKAALDLMLHARRGPFQALMPRDPIRIRRVPRQLAKKLARHLTNLIQLDPIFFAKAKSGQAEWKVYDRHKNGGTEIDPDFQDVVLRFRASGALKALAKHCGLADEGEEIILYKDIDIDPNLWPEELGYAPYALAVTPKGAPWVEKKRWKGSSNLKIVKSWPAVIKQHILHWGYNERARKYGTNDVVYTRGLHRQVFNSVPAGDRDSELACLVAAVRWSGFAIDIPALVALKADSFAKIKSAPRDARKSREYLLEVWDEETKSVALQDGTGKAILNKLIEDKDWDGHPVKERAKKVLEAREAKKLVEVIDKLLLAKRLHPDFNVTGALSNRMSGAGGLSAHGMNHSKQFRKCFTFAGGPDEEFDSGDFDSFELSIAAVVFQDEKLTSDLLAEYKLHSFMGAELSGLTYEQVNATKGTKEGRDWYDTGKKGNFLIFYGGEANTFVTKLGIELEIGQKAVDNLCRKYTGIKRFGDQVQKDFGALSQAGGMGTQVKWTEPKKYVESFLGFRRFFELEYKIVKALYELAQNPPPDWKKGEGAIRVTRSIGRLQTASGAVASSLYGAAFQLVAGVIRAAKNHYIQSPGAEITKEVQVRIWDHQPRGIGPWVVKPMSVHDEIDAVVKKEASPAVALTVNQTVESFRPQVPLIKLEWKTGLSNWSEK